MAGTPGFGFAVPIFAGTKSVHPRTPLLDRLDVAQLARSIVEGERLGYDSMWAADHLTTGIDGAIMEGWTFMSWAAGMTSRMRIGSIHLAQLFRNPALTAKMAATLDCISRGRLDFFYEPGSPFSRREVEAYGFEWLDDADRMAAFEEAVQIVKLMWTRDRPSFEGRFHRILQAICYPRPVQRPHPPVWIGTFGLLAASDTPEPHVFDVIARHANGWNSTPASVDHCRAVLGGLRQACERNGRDFGTLKLSLETEILIAETGGQVSRLQELVNRRNPGSKAFEDWPKLGETFLVGDAAAVTRKIERYVELGIDRFIIWFMDYPSLDGMRLFARKVMPYFGAALGGRPDRGGRLAEPGR
ncbi:MAG: LLM class flavin-dependent oxidoreductase [Chloroflexi bacterium]|nr:LLM class flavin-dependent oxidoreductase [Chloroflexota bacterium]